MVRASTFADTPTLKDPSEEIEVVVEESKEDSADVTEQSVLGEVIEDIQKKVQVIAPVLYGLVRAAP